MIGQKIILEYFDQNKAFEREFPRQRCEVVKQFSSRNGTNNWFLLKLEQTFLYDGIQNTHLIVRSRWKGYEIGDTKPTSVFILLIPDHSLLSEPLDIDKLQHVAWGMAYATETTA